MLENEFYLSKLIAARIRGELSLAEEKELAIWLASAEENQALLKAFEEDQLIREKIKEFQSVDPAGAWSKMRRKLQDTNLDFKPAKQRKWPYIAAVASLVLISAVSFYFYTQKVERNKSADVYNQSELYPGKNGATLTLSDGKKIALSDAASGELATETGVTISKTADQQLVYTIKQSDLSMAGGTNTLATDIGQNYQVNLPDGTVVWLNAASTLKYPASFAANKVRKVVLSGEAYFQVAKDKSHPFVVETNQQEIRVLGTHFNVTAYNDEKANTTTLLEGSVHISRLPAKAGENVALKGKTLTPGEQAVLTDQVFQISTIDSEEAVAWKNGYFRFNKENIADVMRKLARWYHIEVIYEGPVPEEEFSGTASRSKSIGQVLKMLQYSKSVQFKVEGRRVTVKK